MVTCNIRFVIISIRRGHGATRYRRYTVQTIVNLPIHVFIFVELTFSVCFVAVCTPSDHHVCRFQLLQEAAENRHRVHRQQHIPAALQGDRRHPGGVLDVSHVPPIHRRPDRLHCRRRPPENHGHILLDILDVHITEPGRRSRRQGRRPARCRVSRGRRGRDQVPQVLPVGVLCTYLPGHVLLPPQVHVEDVGRRPHQGASPGTQYSDNQRRIQIGPQKAIGQLLCH